MKNKQVDKLLEPAIELISTYLEKDQKVPKEYESATSSFGGSVVQSGALAACALYLKSSDSETDKAKLVFILLKLIEKLRGTLTDNAGNQRHIAEITDNKERNKKLPKEWMQLVIDVYENDTSRFKNELINATIALKLAMRTFHLVKKQS